MNKKRMALMLGIILVIFYIFLQFIPKETEKNTSLFYRGKKPKIIAHGGAKEMYPENTVYAFEQVMKYPVDVLEVDLHLTKDNYLVGIHNDTINAYTEYKGHVYEYTYAQLLEMNFGYHFKSEAKEYPFRNVDDDTKKKLVPVEARQLLHMYREDVLYLFEIKDSGKRGKRAIRILNEIVKEENLQKQVCICSFDKVVMEFYLTFKEKDITSVMDYPTSEKFVVSNYYGYDTFMSFPHDGAMFPMQERNVGLDSRYLIWKAHKNNKFVYYWTIDDPKEMKKLIEYGADGIISDRVDILSEMLQNSPEK